MTDDTPLSSRGSRMRATRKYLLALYHNDLDDGAITYECLIASVGEIVELVASMEARANAWSAV
jgi:hypothetical protein